MNQGASTPQPPSGRELARERRRALSQNGKAALQGGTQQSQPTAPSRETAGRGPSTAQAAPERSSGGGGASRGAGSAPPSGGKGSNGREVARRHRRALARNGKAAVGMVRAGSPRVQTLEQLARTMDVDCRHLSGREICRLRRQMLSQVGKSAFGSDGGAQGSPAPSSHEVAHASTPSADRSVEDKNDCSCGCGGQCSPEECTCNCRGRPGDPAVDEDPVDALCEVVEVGGPGSLDPEVRRYCRERRRALASQGKPAASGRKPAEQGQAAAGSEVPLEDVWRKAAAQGLSGREIARRRRQARCLVGSADPSQCLESESWAGGVPPKVEEGTTLRGGHVSGTQVDRTPEVTGGESGTCHPVTGTDYSGLEQYETFCGAHPEPVDEEKVGEDHTLRGRSVTGTRVGRSPRVTGDEYGACRAVTGTEYIGADQYEEVCRQDPPAPSASKVRETVTGGGERVSGNPVGRSPRVTGDEYGACRAVTGTEYINVEASEVPCVGKAEDVPSTTRVTHAVRGRDVSETPVARSASGGSKVMLSTTEGGRDVSGAAVGRSPKVTGDESGSCGHLTGTQYVNPRDFASLCERPRAEGPEKVGVMHTLHGREVSGTQVDRPAPITGDDHGACTPVSGTEYMGSEHYRAVCGTQPEAGRPEKVSVSRTWQRQSVSGASFNRSDRVTGDEYGACKPVTGTAYIGPDQYQAFCGPTDVHQAAARVPHRGGTPGHPVTGTQPGYDRDVTGTEPGRCQSLTGTPYVGADEYAAHCGSNAVGEGVEAQVHPRFRPMEDGAMATASAPTEAPASVPYGAFSVSSPAKERQASRVTGTAYGAAGRISGSANKGMGLISGTPEFRYGEGEAAPAAEQPEPATFRRGPTGEGSEDGFRVTGDSWQRGERVTGTEGAWDRRNPTLRGQSRGQGATAASYKDLERPEVPRSPITGSAGNTDTGPSITLSGGARG